MMTQRRFQRDVCASGGALHQNAPRPPMRDS